MNRAGVLLKTNRQGSDNSMNYDIAELKKNLPALADKKIWICFQIIPAKDKDGNPKTKKIPKDPNSETGELAESDNPNTWGTIDQAYSRLIACGYQALGIALCGNIMGLDLDHVIYPDGKIEPFAEDIINTVDTYTEFSPSNTGLHSLFVGNPKLSKNKRKIIPKDKDSCELEMYHPFIDAEGKIQGGRFLTVTGKVYKAYKPIQERTEQAQKVHDKYLNPQQETKQLQTKSGNDRSVVLPSMLSDMELIQKAISGKNGSRFYKLWNGDISDYGNDHSNATMALVNDLCYWTNGDASRIDSLFRQSGLYRTMKIEGGINKWDKVHVRGRTYGQYTIETALANFTPYIPGSDVCIQNSSESQKTEEQTASMDQNTEQNSISILPDFVSWDKVCDNLPELPPEVIEGVLKQGHKMCLTGSSKAGKTIIIMQLCVALAEGRKWLNYFQCKQCKVLYINLEIDAACCLDRFNRIITALEWSQHHKDNLLIWNLRGKVPPPDLFVEELITRLKDTDIKVVVIDPIYKIINGDENNSEEIKRFAERIDRICEETKCSIIYNHHHTKGSQVNKDIIDRASGSGVFARDVDAFVDLTKAELEPSEMKNLEEGESIWEFNAVLRYYLTPKEKYLWYKYPLHIIDTDGKAERYLKKAAPKKSRKKAGVQQDDFTEVDIDPAFDQDGKQQTLELRR